MSEGPLAAGDPIDRSGLEAELATPGIRGLLDQHTALREPVTAVLAAAAAVRRTARQAFPAPGLGEPRPTRERSDRARELTEAVDNLDNEVAAGADAAAAGEAVRRFLRAALELRAAGHAFSPARRSTGPIARAALMRALELHRGAFERLAEAARGCHAGRLPWRLVFATHAAPTTPVGELEVTGYELPRTPVAGMAWGERCCLSGIPFNTDSRRAPAVRYRSLDAMDAVLAPPVYELVARARKALDELRDRAPEAVAEVARALPLVYDAFVAERWSPGFAKLGLKEFPSQAVWLNNVLRSYADRPAFGIRGGDGAFPALGAADRVRVAVDGEDAAATGFCWITYEEVRLRSLRLAHGLQQLGLRRGERIALIASENLPELYIAEFAAVFAGLTTVGVQDTLDDEALLGTVAGAAPAALLGDGVCLARLAAAGVADRCGSLRHIIGLRSEAGPAGEGPAVTAESLIAGAGEASAGWRSASGIGFETPVLYDDDESFRLAAELGIEADGPDELHTIIYTSGSTGRPKGTPVTRVRWREGMEYGANLWPHVVVSYQPFALAADRKSVWQALHNGGRVGFARRGAALFDDIRAIRPTYFEGPPAIWNTIYGRLKAGLAEAAGSSREAARAQLELSGALGGRVAAMAVGGAPSDPLLRRSLSLLFGVPMSDGYGATEAGALGADGRLADGLDFRLVDLPELGYTSSDQPFPRGELAVRTPYTKRRYVDDEEANREAFTEDGYFLTGDIVEVRPDGSFAILGRRKELFKLAGSEFVAPARLEEVFGRSPEIASVFVTAAPGASRVAAVVVPTSDDVGEAQVQAALAREAARAGLRPFEIPEAVVLERGGGGGDPWTPENGLRTPSYKLNRKALEERYREAVAGAAAETAGRPASGDRPAPDEDPAATVARLAAAVLGVDPSALDMTRSFADNGGDSLGAVDFALGVERALGAPADGEEIAMVPLAELARRRSGAGNPAPADAARAAAPGRARPASAAGASPASTAAAAEAIAAVALADALSAPLPAVLPPPTEGKDILLTGGAGFLGVHLVAELAGSAGEGQRVVALVRAPSHDAARQRLMNALTGAGLAPGPVGVPGEPDGAIIAVAGDVERDRLGLGEALYAELCERVGLIHHAAGKVAFGADYMGLRGPNVLGTRHVLELATTGRLKAVHLVSSLNVAVLIGRASGRPPLEWSALPERLTPEIVAAEGAYAVSKWAAEGMAHLAFLHCTGRLRISVSRPALITWSSATGTANRSDWMTRVLESCLALRCVPGPSDAGAPAWVPETATSARGLDLVPVDFAARAIARLGALTASGALPAAPARDAATRVPTFHVSNTAPEEGGLVTWAHLLDALTAADRRQPGDATPLRRVSLHEWWLRVEAAGAPAAAVKPLLGDGLPALPRTPASRFQAAMAGTDELPPVVCSPFGVDLMQRFFERPGRRAG